MTVSEKIKARIAYLKAEVARIDQDGFDEYYFGWQNAMNREIDFLVDILDDIERKTLKEDGYNV
jgi:hypothetical protein